MGCLFSRGAVKGDDDHRLIKLTQSTATSRVSPKARLPILTPSLEPVGQPLDEQESQPPSPPLTPFELEVFRIQELAEATRQFLDPDMVLGEGGFGKVFKGWLKDPVTMETYPVAVKRLNPDSFQGQNEWLVEILVLGRLRHPNLVRLVGYCAHEGEGLLVFEFLAKGSLDYYLFREDMNNTEQPPLPWVVRLKIALDGAQGLAKLHEHNVTHCLFKPSNILLDEEYRAKLIDFGWPSHDYCCRATESIRVMEAKGYLDPWYQETGCLRKITDVYAFGVVLLELLTGRRANVKIGDRSLAEWVYLQEQQQNFSELVDPALATLFQGNSPQQKNAQRAAFKLAKYARYCTNDDPHKRPFMSKMVERLKLLVQAAIKEAEQ
eukprot:TRINITY_DN332_c0_g1_i6.p1 TRINITY_DN332_c0_g1~~TRINITY_DN332_c0_g1_i6.p1  ORF type:complete len:379 (+),score=61.45 TRINITY_DN332_c0_g1_i6:1379-2515(+)